MQAADEEIVEHPVHVGNDVVVSGICPYIMPCAMRYSGLQHERHCVLADEMGAGHDDTCRLVSHHSNGEDGMWEAWRHDTEDPRASACQLPAKYAARTYIVSPGPKTTA